MGIIAQEMLKMEMHLIKKIKMFLFCFSAQPHGLAYQKKKKTLEDKLGKCPGRPHFLHLQGWPVPSGLLLPQYLVYRDMD